MVKFQTILPSSGCFDIIFLFGFLVLGGNQRDICQETATDARCVGEDRLGKTKSLFSRV